VGVALALTDAAVEFVLTLNNDAMPAPLFLERLIAAADGSPRDYGSWQGKVVSAAEPRLIDAVGLELTRDSLATQVGYLEVDARQYPSGDVYGVNAAAALYSRQFIEDVAIDGELFDSDFFAYLEDVDLAVRGVGAGWKAAYVSDAVAHHVGSATGGVESPFKWRVTSRNKLFLQVKNYNVRELAASLVPTAAAELRLLLGFLRTSQWGALGTYVGSRLGACFALRPMLAKRRVVLGRRVAASIFAPPRPRVAPAAGVRLSVVIPNWNGREELATCLAALRQQTVRDLEIIVVDNGSSDGSVEFIREHHPEVIALPLAVNLGFAGGVNVGIKASNGEFVALLNNDAVADQRWAEEMLAAMDHGDIAASLMLERDAPEVVDSAGEFLSKWGVPYRHRRGAQAADVSSEGYPEIFAASGGISRLRRTVLADVGVFDPQYFAYLEDVDIGFRARLAGDRIVLAPRARVLHGVGATAEGLGQFQLHQFIKNSHLLFWKNVPLRSLVKMLPRFAVVQAHLFVAAVRRGAVIAALRAYAATAVRFPMILVKRRRVQRLRTTAPADVDAWFTDHWPMDTNPAQRLRSILRTPRARRRSLRAR
jgi:GT2 family glycosyltransferase